MSSSGDDFSALTARLDELASRIEPGKRKALAGAIATDLRRAQAKRIRSNVQPDGEAMTPRKPQLRSPRLRDAEPAAAAGKRGRMFQRAVAPRYLRKGSSPDHAQVGFAGAMARIMRPHHYGLEDSVSRAPGAPRVRYPARVVLGFEPADRERILDQVMGALAG